MVAGRRLARVDPGGTVVLTGAVQRGRWGSVTPTFGRVSDVSCPGCRLVLPRGGSAASRPGVDASPECLELDGRLTATVLQHPATLGRWHQTSVDAYLLQHVGAATKPLAVNFALNGLYLVLERGWAGTAARAAHQRLAARVPREDWVRLEPPDDVGDVRVLDVVRAGDVTETAELIQRWGWSVWRAWRHAHEEVRETTVRRLAGGWPSAGAPDA